jgi:peptide/nickel transport system ATP-binding protein
MALRREKRVSTAFAEPEVLARVQKLSVAFVSRSGIRTAVEDASFELVAGRVLALVGESGSGKSVTARALLGLAGRNARVTARQLDIEGQSALGLSEARWRRLRGRRIGLVLQDALVSLDPLRPIGIEVREVLDVHRLGPRQGRWRRMLEALRRTGVPDPERRARQRSSELSGGLRQRALIAAAIVSRPRILIADEPTTALDAPVQRQILDLLRDMARAGNAILLITHDIGVVSAAADDVAVMQGGRIVERGLTEDVLTRPVHPYTRTLLASLPSSRPTRNEGLCSEDGPPFKAAATSAPAIVVEDVSKNYRDPDGRPRPVLANIGFSVRRGQTLGLVGESGAGKSTIANILMGFLEPDAGRVAIMGRPWSGVSERQRRPYRPALQMIYQDPLGSFDPRLTVAQILAGAYRAVGVIDRAVVRRRSLDLMKTVGLGAEHLALSPAVLSGGQRQRIAVARALAPQPAILICDEPVSALDLTTQAQVLDLLTSVQAKFNLACVFISHDLSVVRHVSDEIIVLRHGRSVERGPTATICTAPADPYTQQLFAAMPPVPAASFHDPSPMREGRTFA